MTVGTVALVDDSDAHVLPSERERLIKAAHRVIGDGGRSTPIEAVLREARVNRRVFYRNFASKDELILAMQQEASELATKALRAAVDGAEDGRTAAVAWIDWFLGIGWDERRAREGRTFLAPEVGQVVGIAQALEDIHDEHRGICAQALSRGAADGSLPDCRPLRDAFAIHAIALRCLEMRARGRLDRPFADVRDELVELLA